ncbi:MAG: YdcF family protein [Moraxella sp.]|nr:YdcF family protein [Moraxella sp.]
MFCGILAGTSVFTPIFANVGVFALDLFSKITLDTAPTPTAMTVLGGGLTKKDGEIALNHYSQSRADTVISLYSQNPLPVITSGAESPWLREHIKSTLPQAVIISDNASMNTCENAVFTAKLMNHHELPTSVYLITDRYHMARARRQFARAGIMTSPVPAPLVIPLSWTSIQNNLVHSRRTAYEMLALARDIFRPQENCRTTDKISLEEISTPRRKPKVFSLLFD